MWSVQGGHDSTVKSTVNLLFLSKVREQKMTITCCFASSWHSGRGAWAVTGSLGRQGVLGGGRAWVWRGVV